MAVIPISVVSPGSVLAKPVHDPNGQLLAPSGVTVSDRHLRLFEARRVDFVEVAGDDPRKVSLDPVAVEAARRRLVPRFVHQDPAHPLIDALMELSIRRQLLEEMAA